jgi:beta-glucosidase
MVTIDPFAPDRIADRLVSSLQDRTRNWGFLMSIVQGHYCFPFGAGLGSIGASCCDNSFMGLNYYGRNRVRFDLTSPSTLFGSLVPAPPETAWPEPWPTREMYPEGMAQFVTKLARYQHPIYVTDNGLADVDDSKRPGFIIGHLAALHRAIQQGADVRGYYHWTLVDNYEWVEGWTTRFGLIALDSETQERTPRPSMELYAQIARENAITEDVVGIYAPELLDSTFAGTEF